MVTSLPVENWQFYSAESHEWLDARVPGCIHTDLRRHNLIPDPFWGANEQALQWIEQRDWSYRAELVLTDAQLAHEHLDLVCEGLDTVAVVTVNGTVVGQGENMFCSHRFSVREVLRPGTNTIEVLFSNVAAYLDAHADWIPDEQWADPIGGPRRAGIRKQQSQFGWDWGPRFVTCGIWRPIRLEGWSDNRLVGVKVQQQRNDSGAVTLKLIPELARTDASASLRGTVRLRGESVGSFLHHRCTLSSPELWWPAGQGSQPLYELDLELVDGNGDVLDTGRRRIGIRSIELVRDKDDLGESFYFRVNGRPIFAKGANWIPDHAFVTSCTADGYRQRLQAAVDANMNMLRVWGGGTYEADVFYDLCDELGLLVWQDFMFACALYPGAPAFVDLVAAEAEQQIRRLRDHASLALWCGNNEIPMMRRLNAILCRDRREAVHYARIFHSALPDAVSRFDGQTPYWPSSPWTPPELFADPNAQNAGDVHFWEVWHSRAPVKAYEALEVRFCSEFGMQSYASDHLATTFCPPEQRNVFSPVMENHQKNGGGNATMLHYMAQRYRYAGGYANLAYVSQLNQAWCMKVAIEHFRHRMPYTMGALYWQLNDCWPAASWSSLEFGGAWKALHHEARRFFAPTLLYLRTAGDVKIGQYNTVHNSIENYSVFVVHDGPKTQHATVRWSVRDVRGAQVGSEFRQDLEIAPGKVIHVGDCSLPAEPAMNVRARCYLRAELATADGSVLSRQNAFFTVPRFLELEDPRITTAWRQTGELELRLSLRAESLAVAVAVHFGDLQAWLSDNWFDLHAGETLELVVRPNAGTTLSQLEKALSIQTLWHSYQGT